MELFINYISLELGHAVVISDSTITLASGGSELPAGGTYRAMIDAEIMIVESGAPSNTLSVLRGQEGTTVANHAIDAPVIIGLTAGALEQLKEDILDASSAYPANYVIVNNTNSPYVPNPGDYVAVDLNLGPVVIAPAGLTIGEWFEWKIRPGNVPTSVNSLTVNPMFEGQLEQPGLGLGTLGGAVVYELATDAGTAQRLVSDGLNLEIWT